jgi:acyl dehydratase
MIEVETTAELAAHVGEELGRSGWVTIPQAQIDAFADLTGDDQWIHVDTERAAQEMPGGSTIAHGLLVLSLVPKLQRECWSIRQRGRGLNYGYDRNRFASPVPAGARVRLAITLIAVERDRGGTRIVTEQVVELEGGGRPAMVARHLVLVLDA